MRVFLAAAAAAIFLTVPAQAREIRVAAPSAQLNTPAGAERVYDALQQASARVCRDAGVYGYRAPTARRTCQAEVLAQSVQRLNAPLVTALHHNQGPRQVLAAR